MKTFGNYPTDEKIEEIIKRDFKKETGLEAVDISHIFPMDRGITIHTENRTWHGKLTYSARKIEKGSLQEEVVEEDYLSAYEEEDEDNQLSYIK